MERAENLVPEPETVVFHPQTPCHFTPLCALPPSLPCRTLGAQETEQMPSGGVP